tara:strand:+ start:290 stop:496 length:207 start_codon:yes stop_codon:yes gene_type:complete
MSKRPKVSNPSANKPTFDEKAFNDVFKSIFAAKGKAGTEHTLIWTGSEEKLERFKKALAELDATKPTE